ncbi:hypothetical protein RND71_019265 [Anisodus tanguticus]|uniref:DUF1985 domain-containing protein n=1 Tax=Anisodus tanguticus TaxID=243964 RepID=A0AAE1RYN7_9SOLA|nr:hypothetical protein RND71_019265 [Anisodus tanguticus]
MGMFILLIKSQSIRVASPKQESTRRTRSQVKPVVKHVKAGKRKVENDNENVKKKRKVLALVENEDSYFGYFLDFPPFKNQNQLIYALLLKKIAPGLKCYEDDNTVYDEPEVNRLLKEYFFEDEKKSVTTESLLDRFKQKGWKSDDDALKMAILVFVHHFLFSVANNHSILKKDFDIVESGQYQSVQRILNWQVKEGPTFVDLASGKLMTSIYQVAVSLVSCCIIMYKSCIIMYKSGCLPNITPTSEEKSRLNIATFSEDANVDDVPLEDAPTFHNDHSNVVPPVHPQNIEQQPRPRFSTFASLEDLKAEIMRLDIEKLTGKVMLLNDYVVSSFKRLFKLFDPKVTKEKGDDVPVSENHQSVDNDAAYDHDGYQHFDDHNFTADVPEGNMTTDEIKSNVKANEGVIDGISGAADATANDSKNWYNDELTDEVLTKLIMSQIVLHRQHTKKEEDMTPEELTRIKFPGRWNQSPFVVKFGSDINSTSKTAPKCIF